MQLLIHQHAVNDLEKLWCKIFNQTSKSLADEYYIEIISILKKIQTQNSMGKSIEFIRDGYTVCETKNELICYRSDLKNQLEIVRILPKKLFPSIDVVSIE